LWKFGVEDQNLLKRFAAHVSAYAPGISIRNLSVVVVGIHGAFTNAGINTDCLGNLAACASRELEFATSQELARIVQAFPNHKELIEAAGRQVALKANEWTSEERAAVRAQLCEEKRR
jgi:hypothetical protein